MKLRNVVFFIQTYLFKAKIHSTELIHLQLTFLFFANLLMLKKIYFLNYQ